MPLARAAAQRALDIDPLLAGAHAGLGIVAGMYDFDWEEAERRFRLATARNPVPSDVRFPYARYLLSIGRLHDAIGELERALEEDPLNVPLRASLAGYLLAAGRQDDALRHLRQLLDLDEHSWFGLNLMGRIYGSKGLFPEALAFLEKAYALAPWDDVTTGALAGVLMRTGDASRAEALLQKLSGRPAHAAPLGFVLFHLACGDMDKAADWAEKAIEHRHPAIVFFMQGLRSSPRWPGLMRMMNLPAEVA
jgi:tetratricopeptide (TPR) repeat protein